MDLTWPLRHAATIYPELEAAVGPGVRCTFAQLDERVRGLGGGLAALGVERGSRVATLMSNTHRYLEMHLAVPGLGALIVPLNSRLSVREMREILQDCGAGVLVVDDELAAVGAALEDTVDTVVTGHEEYERLVSHAPLDVLPGPASAQEPAGIYYTGGTTGGPKGVVLSHAALIAQSVSLAIEMQVQPRERVLHVFPLFHLGGICTLYVSVWRGVTQVFQPSTDPSAILAAIATERITSTSVVPALMRMILDLPDVRTVDVSSLQRIGHGAAPIDPELCERIWDVFGCRMMQAYGMTEMSSCVTFLHDEQHHLGTARISSAGRAMVGTEVTVRRPDGTLCDRDEVGEVVVRGPGMFSSYWGRPDETAAVRRDGWYWTGDVGYLDEEHYLFLVDRAKDLIVSGGENVYSIEVESVLHTHPAVLEAAVIGVPSTRWGEQVHAVVVARPGASLDEEQLVSHCRENLAGYKCPKSVEFRTDALPRSAVGKVLKTELRRPHWAGSRRIG